MTPFCSTNSWVSCRWRALSVLSSATNSLTTWPFTPPLAFVAFTQSWRPSRPGSVPEAAGPLMWVMLPMTRGDFAPPLGAGTDGVDGPPLGAAADCGEPPPPDRPAVGLAEG